MKPEDFARIANNFYNSKGLDSDYERIRVDADLVNYIGGHQKDLETKYKVALVFICLNPLYWQYAPDMVNGAKDLFLPGHNTDFLFWTDIPEKSEDINQKISDAWKERGLNMEAEDMIGNLKRTTDAVAGLRSREDIKLYMTDSVEWPYPTLLRYNLFLQQEEKLKEYDYIFYCDVDMQFMNIIGDEILGTGITAAVHPGYHIRKEYWPPYEPNPDSASYIKRPGRVVDEEGKPRFMPLYFAGGFQGGKSDKFIEAMKATKKLIEIDMNRAYIPIWNDETAWNKYLSENPPDIVLTPSYIYPDSLINEYYIPLWGKSYQPKLKTLTKWFTLQKGGELQKMIQETKPLQK